MKDVAGYEFEKGNLVQIMLGQQPVVGYVHDVQEGGVPATSSQGVSVVSESGGSVVFAVGSGAYRFTVG